MTSTTSSERVLIVEDEPATRLGLTELVRNRRLGVFALCVVLFHLANAAMLPLAASMLTLRSSQAATIMVAASRST